MVPYSHHGNYTNTALLIKQVQWSRLHILLFIFLESSVEGFSWPGETARTLVAKDIPFIHKDSPYAPLCFTTSGSSSCLECLCLRCTWCHFVCISKEAEHFCAAAPETKRKQGHLRRFFSDQWYSIINMTDIEPNVKATHEYQMHSHIAAPKMEQWAGSQFSLHPARRHRMKCGGACGKRSIEMEGCRKSAL